MLKRLAIIAAGLVVAIGVTVGVATTSASAARLHKCAVEIPGLNGNRPHVVNNGMSLDRWAHRHNTYVGNVLGLTYSCTPGWTWSMQQYLDRGKLHAPLPKGTVLWAFPYGN